MYVLAGVYNPHGACFFSTENQSIFLVKYIVQLRGHYFDRRGFKAACLFRDVVGQQDLYYI